MEVPQCVNFMIQHDLLFQEIVPSLIVEVEETGNQGLEDVGAGEDSGERSWTSETFCGMCF